jgi:hypothetical protein
VIFPRGGTTNALFNNTGSFNIAVGFSAGNNLTTGSNNIDIGAPGVAGESGVIRIGKSPTATATFIAGISGKTVASGVGVIVNSSGQLGTAFLLRPAPPDTGKEDADEKGNRHPVETRALWENLAHDDIIPV